MSSRQRGRFPGFAQCPHPGEVNRPLACWGLVHQENAKQRPEDATVPQSNNNGLSIHYEVEGEGPPLVLHHGSFGSVDDWRDFGYVGALKGRRTLILMDSRGHGKSHKPPDPAEYSLASRASDVIAVLDDLGIRKADFMGYSMGGWIGFGLARYAADRFRSLILGGAHPFQENMQAFRAMLPKEPNEFLALLEPAFGVHLVPAMRERMVTNDLDALHALTLDREDFSDVLPTMRMRCLLFAGSTDPRLPQVEECARRMPNVTFFSPMDCGHVAALGRSDLVLPHLRVFLNQL
jgi:pimeloyl-ACP methyl ester carboxylesterase